nr:hypothetical protein [Enterovibrio nigricans]
MNKPGPCEFVHPWFGIRKVQIGKVSHKLVNKVDGLATFSFEVFEVGENYSQLLSVIRRTKFKLNPRKRKMLPMVHLKISSMKPQRKALATWSINFSMIWMSSPVAYPLYLLTFVNGLTA